MTHVDVIKSLIIPGNDAHQYVGRQQGAQNEHATSGLPRSADDKPRTVTAFEHTMIDELSRVAFAEIHADENATTAISVLHRAIALADHALTVKRV